MAGASQRLYGLRPVKFRYIEADEHGQKPLRYGLIAEEVAATSRNSWCMTIRAAPFVYDRADSVRRERADGADTHGTPQRCVHDGSIRGGVARADCEHRRGGREASAAEW